MAYMFGIELQRVLGHVDGPKAHHGAGLEIIDAEGRTVGFKNLDEAFEKGKKASAVVYCIVNKANQLVIIGIEKQGIRGRGYWGCACPYGGECRLAAPTWPPLFLLKNFAEGFASRNADCW